MLPLLPILDNLVGIDVLLSRISRGGPHRDGCGDAIRHPSRTRYGAGKRTGDNVRGSLGLVSENSSRLGFQMSVRNESGKGEYWSDETYDNFVNSWDYRDYYLFNYTVMPPKEGGGETTTEIIETR
eukprot:124951-Amorphochlora_amoeboformis.AAC.1